MAIIDSICENLQGLCSLSLLAVYNLFAHVPLKKEWQNIKNIRLALAVVRNAKQHH